MMQFRSIIFVTFLLLSIYKVNAQTADDIINKHIEAMGGAQKWEQVKTIKLSGAMSQGGMNIQMSQTIMNGKAMRMDISAMGQNGYMIITQDSGWTYLPFMGQTHAEAIPADQVALGKDKINFSYSQLMDKRQISSATKETGFDTLDGKACYKIVVKDRDGNTLHCSIDKQSYYLLRMVTSLKVIGMEQEVAVNYSDFKTQPEGLVLPVTWSTMQGTVHFSNIEINKPINEKVFRPDMGY
jgi:outer membrane lipoprotein-sorting protein